LVHIFASVGGGVTVNSIVSRLKPVRSYCYIFQDCSATFVSQSKTDYAETAGEHCFRLIHRL